MKKYRLIFTAIGLAKLANAQATQNKLDITHMAIGDANDEPYRPTGDETALVNEVWRTQAVVKIHEKNVNWLEVEAVIPAEIGGFTINEFGLYDADGDFVAISNHPSTPKPVLEEGSLMDLTISADIKSSNAALIELTADPTVITASKGYVDEKIVGISDSTDQKFDQVSTQLAHIIEDNAVSPDSFEGTDFEKVQQALDLAIANKTAIKFARLYDVTHTDFLNINKPDNRFVLQLIGVGGGLKKTNSSYLFSTTRSYTGDILLNNMYFEGIAGTGLALFEGDKVIRVRSNASIYRNVDTIGKAVNNYLQSYDFVNDWVVGGEGSVFETPSTYGLTCTAMTVEHRENFFTQTKIQPGSNFGALYKATFKSCMIEGLTGYAFLLRSTESFSVDDCYFEKNKGGNILTTEGYLIEGFNASNNRCFERSEEYTKTAFIVWKGRVLNAKTYNNSINDTAMHDTTELVVGSIISENDVIRTSGINDIDPNKKIVYVNATTLSQSIKMNNLVMLNSFTGFIRYGKTFDGLVTIELRLTNISTIAGGTVIATLPEGFKPTQPLPILVYKGNIEPFDQEGALVVNYDGTITMGYNTTLAVKNNAGVDGGVMYRARQN